MSERVTPFCLPYETPPAFGAMAAQWNAGVLAGWLGRVLAAEPANPQISLVTRPLRKPPIRRRGRGRASRRDASAPAANATQSLKAIAAFGEA